MLDILIKGGLVYDGSGEPGQQADVAIRDGLIVEVAPRIGDLAHRTIEADGLIVTPGFVDIHTHFDGQLTWDDTLEPSASHGVTTIVVGNCGVGFAPVRPSERDMLIELMEGVEDIPGTALHEGIRWEWESFPEYLDALAKRSYSMDVGALVPHGALRAYVMGERGVANQESTAEDREAMAALLDEALVAGAMGFSTSRVLEHQSTTGAEVPGTFASCDELLAIAAPLKARGQGCFQMVPLGLVGSAAGAGDCGAADERRLDEARIAVRIARDTGRPVTYSLIDDASSPGLAQRMLEIFSDARQEGLGLYPQVSSRGVGALTSFANGHLFTRRPTYLALEGLPEAERLRALATPEVRAAILSEQDVFVESTVLKSNRHLMFNRLFDLLYPVDAEIGFEPTAAQTIAALAAAAGQDPQAYLYDYMLRDGGRQFAVLYVANFNGSNYDAVKEMIEHPHTVLGLSDAGAHVSVLCDASNPTFQLSFWGRDRQRGPTLPLELLIAKQTSATAAVMGLHDRGTVRAGLRADLNVIDRENLALRPQRMVHDLPLQGARVLQGASGYRATLVGGVVTREADADTGARPGRLVRSGH